jgi:RimJ/RimL family protein N-acetyltransferase
MADHPSNVDLLEAEIEIIWGPGRRPHEAPPSVVIGDAGDAMIVMARDDLDASVREALRTIASRQRSPLAARSVHEALQQALGPLDATVGPSYDCSSPAEQPDPVTGRLIRFDQLDRGELAGLHRAVTWEAEEWDDLLAGRIGPWAMVIDRDGDGDRVLSLCHSARFAATGFEAGTWTTDGARGKGLAAAATAAWAAACREIGGHIFYSTDAYNLASQRVAARLKLPPIGQLWKYRPAGEGDGPPATRLSVLAKVA